jgi:hypothetical protein
MSADEQDLLALDDNPFEARWRDLSDEERSAIGARGFEHYRKLSPYVPDSLRRLERAQASPVVREQSGATSVRLICCTSLTPEPVCAGYGTATLRTASCTSLLRSTW